MSATIRTFRAADARSALAAVKAALGPDAVILSTREVSGGLFRPPEVEVTAAKPDAVPNVAAATHAYGAHTKQFPKVELRPMANVASAPPPRAEPVSAPAMHNELAEELIHLRSQLEHLRRELRSSGPSRVGTQFDFSPSAAELFCQLINGGMEESLAEELVRQASHSPHGANAVGLQQSIRELLSAKLVTARAPWMPERRRIISLVGPTGVGKTTTMAKIAARALMESNQKVAMITVDTYRIGASEQVSRYGQIMNMPTHVARNRAELGKAIEKSSASDLILIDTAGRSVSEAVAKQAELIRSVPGVELHLVLSAATGARELAMCADRYRSLKPERMIFTKIDEAYGAGALLSPTVRLSAPVTAVADGQRVPEDLHSFTSFELADLILGTKPEDRRELGAMRR